LITSRSFPLRMRNVSDKICRENQNTNSIVYIFFNENHAVYEIMWRNTVKPNNPEMTTRHMRIAWWITKATYVHTECVILIALPGINGCTTASCKMSTRCFSGVKCSRGVILTTHPLLVQRSCKSRAIPLPTLWATPGL